MKKKLCALALVLIITVPLAIFVLPGVIPSTIAPVYNGVWNLQPTMDELMIDGETQGVTTNAWQILNFDPDGHPSQTVLTSIDFVKFPTFDYMGLLPAVSTSVGDVVFDESTPTGETTTGLTPLWYRFHMTVETNGKWGYATMSNPAKTSDRYWQALQPVAEWEMATTTVYFDVNLWPTPLFDQSFNAVFEKVRIEEVRTGVSTRVGWDWAQIENWVDDWDPMSIAPAVDFFTAAGVNIINSKTDIEGGEIAHCSLSLELLPGYIASPGTANPITNQVIDAAEWTPQNVFAEIILVTQLLIDTGEDGGPPPQVGWWESFLYVIQDLQTRVQTFFEALAEDLGPWLVIIGIAIFIIIITFIIIRYRR